MQAIKEAKKTVNLYGGTFIRMTKSGFLYKFDNGAKIVIPSSSNKTGWLKDLEKRLSRLGLSKTGTVFIIQVPLIVIIRGTFLFPQFLHDLLPFS